MASAASPRVVDELQFFLELARGAFEHLFGRTVSIADATLALVDGLVDGLTPEPADEEWATKPWVRGTRRTLVAAVAYCGLKAVSVLSWRYIVKELLIANHAVLERRSKAQTEWWNAHKNDADVQTQLHTSIDEVEVGTFLCSLSYSLSSNPEYPFTLALHQEIAEAYKAFVPNNVGGQQTIAPESISIRTLTDVFGMTRAFVFTTCQTFPHLIDQSGRTRMYTSFVVFVGTNYDVRTHGLRTFIKGWFYNLKGYVLPTVELNTDLYGTDPEGKPFKGHSGFAYLNENLAYQLRYCLQDVVKELSSAAELLDNKVIGHNVILTGHSLGGALAVLNTLSLSMVGLPGDQSSQHPLRIMCFTTACPPVLELPGARQLAYDGSRVVNVSPTGGLPSDGSAGGSAFSQALALAQQAGSAIGRAAVNVAFGGGPSRATRRGARMAQSVAGDEAPLSAIERASLSPFFAAHLMPNGKETQGRNAVRAARAAARAAARVAAADGDGVAMTAGRAFVAAAGVTHLKLVMHIVNANDVVPGAGTPWSGLVPHAPPTVLAHNSVPVPPETIKPANFARVISLKPHGRDSYNAAIRAQPNRWAIVAGQRDTIQLAEEQEAYVRDPWRNIRLCALVALVAFIIIFYWPALTPAEKLRNLQVEGLPGLWS